MKVLVFLHGTAIMHAAAVGVSRDERVRQVRVREESVRRFASYVPTERAVEKVTAWAARGIELGYLSSHLNAADIAADAAVLAAHRFPPGPVHARAGGESYADLVTRLDADLLVEDDCESIGGIDRTVARSLDRSGITKPRCVVVAEFGGLAHLPDDPAKL